MATKLASKFSACGSSGGSIALRNTAQKSVAFSASLTDSAPRVASLHRDFLRSVPWMQRAYNVQMPVPKMRSLLTQSFRDKKNATDLHTINRLVVQGRMELEETLQLWKGSSHVVGWFERADLEHKKKFVKPEGFLDKFYSGSA